MRKLPVILAFFISLIFCGEAFSLSSFVAEDSVYLANKNYRLQTGLYDVYKTKQADIVMLGNSITHGVNWFELLGRNDVIGRGIPSDITQGFLNRMEYVFNLHPKICFVMGGINDIYSNIPLNVIFDNYKKVIERLREKGIVPVIQSTLYVSPKWRNAVEKNPEVEKFNELLRKYAAQNKIEFLDLNPLLSEGKFLKDIYTYDGVHLNGEAYRIWGIQVENTLKKYGI